ncbi:MAG: substrate-binding periplasmic protein [Cellvibrionaceae bacterium]
MNKIDAILYFFIAQALFLFPSFSAAQTIQLKTEHYPPYNIDTSEQNGSANISGASFEIVSELMKRSKYNYNIELIPWKRALESASKNNYTGVFSTTRTESREKSFKWVGPIADNNYVLMAANKNIKIESNNDLQRYSIGAYQGGAGDNILKSLNIKTELVRSDHLNVRKLKRGRIDLWITGNLYGPYLAKQYDVKGLTSVHTLKEAKMYIAFNLNTPNSIIDNLNNTLKKMRKEGFLDKVFNKYTN